MVYKHAEERQTASGKITEIYLTANNLKKLKRGAKARLKVKGAWIYINPMPPVFKTKKQLRIEKLEAELAILKKQDKEMRGNKRWKGKSPEEIKAHMDFMRSKRVSKVGV